MFPTEHQQLMSSLNIIYLWPGDTIQFNKKIMNSLPLNFTMINHITFKYASDTKPWQSRLNLTNRLNCHQLKIINYFKNKMPFE